MTVSRNDTNISHSKPGLRTPPLVILGIDAGDSDFIQRWTAEGYLPTIHSIMQRGCWGRTVGPELCSELGTGVSLFSGVSRNRHGYYWFRQLKPGTYDLQTFAPRDADALPFWSYLRGRDKKIAVIDAHEVSPVPGLQGIQLAHWTTLQPAAAILPASAEPVELLKDARRVFGQQMPLFGSEFKLNSSFEEDRQIYRRLLQRIEKKGELCRYLLTQNNFDLVVAGFFESHIADHRFWDYRPQSQAKGKVSKGENELTHAIRDVYQAIDRQMGLLLAQLPSEANVFVISLSGMKDEYPKTGLMESFCRRLGYQASAEASASAPSSLSLRRMIPQTWRSALSNHLPPKVQERLLADQFRSGTNWKKTKAFAIPSLYTSFVRINLRGREPEGIVEPGTQYEALLDCLEADLWQLIDPQTGEPAVEQMTRTVKIFDCEPPNVLPDLFVEWKPSTHFVERVIHPKAELTQEKSAYFRSSWHTFNGFVAAAGPSIRRQGTVGNISLLDIAPTFLHLLGEPAPQEMTGKVIEV